MSPLDLISDHSKEKLVTVPSNVLDMNNLKMLFLEGNFLTKLPDDLFWRLPKLMWLDLRNNLLESLPTSIAFHEKLENLLLSNNNLERLPNELGTVSNLKALQVTENPLIYPERKIIMEGTKAIKNFLKQQYDKTAKEEISDRITELDENSIQTDEDNEERFLGKVEPDEIYPDTTKSEDDLNINLEETALEQFKSKFSDEQCVNPDLEVKKLLPPVPGKKKEQEPVKIVHKISRNGSKIYLKSSISKPNQNNANSDEKKFKNLKEGWLNELRILLNDQERILQQERNLRAISNWRLKNKSDSSEERPRVFHGDLPKPPYDTDPDYYRMPTREELAQSLNEFKQKGCIRSGDSAATTPLELQRMIKNIMDQLKDMEIHYDSTNTSIEMEQAEKQIRAMMDIQKQLMSLKSINDSTL